MGGVMRASLPVGKSLRQSSLPVLASWQKTLNTCLAVMPVLNTRPLAMTAEPMPSPSLARQSTLSSWENLAGKLRLDEMPLLLSPRNCGQSSA